VPNIDLDVLGKVCITTAHIIIIVVVIIIISIGLGVKNVQVKTTKLLKNVKVTQIKKRL